MNYLLHKSRPPMRLKHILSHHRNIDMVMTTNTIRYSIPLHSEKEYMGDFVSAKVKDGYLLVVYKSKNLEDFAKPVLQKHNDTEEANFIVDFSK